MTALLGFFAIFLLSAHGHRICTSCIPLEDLLSEAYGIEATVDGLSLAVAYHNGTTQRISSSAGSHEYTTAMQSVVDGVIGQPPQTRRAQCPYKPPPAPQPSPLQEFLHYVALVMDHPSILWNPLAKAPPAPIDPAVRLFEQEILKLAPFASMSSAQLAEVSYRLAIPGWLTASPTACYLAEAAGRLFDFPNVVGSHPSACFTAMGYELCGVSYDAFDCTCPGRIMTADFQENGCMTLTVIKTPISWSVMDPVTFAVARSLSHEEMLNWIDSFVSAQHPDLVMFTGLGWAKEPQLKEAIQRSDIHSLLIDQSAIQHYDVAAVGAAQAAKDGLEGQTDDCTEPEECRKIRREADRIAGRISLPRPSVWPAVAGNRHNHDEL